MNVEQPLIEPKPSADPESDEAEFDALHSLIRLLLGGALEGSDELVRRLTVWEAYLRREQGDGQTLSSKNNSLRYALIGLVFEGEECARRGWSLAWRAQKHLAKTVVRTTHPLIHNRLTTPLQRRIGQHVNRAAERGQAEIVHLIERGQREEPFSREMARLALAEFSAEIISQLAQNEEVQDLVQQQSVGLVSEVVGQVRTRTVTADSLVERLARGLARRSPRLDPPTADLSEFPQT
jgi:hypothetical protein